MSAHPRVLILLAWCAASACAGGPWRYQTPLTAAKTAQARARLTARPTPPGPFVADGTLHAFARGQRVRAKVQLLVDGARFRLTAFGPHGAAMWVAASDGQTLTAYDASTQQSLRAPATREGLASIAHGLDVGLPLPQWLLLLSYSGQVPDGAIAYERPHGQIGWAWTDADSHQAQQALCDRAGRLVAVRLPTADGGEVQASFLPRSDDAWPIAKEIDVRVSGADGRAQSQLSLSVDELHLSPVLSGGAKAFEALP